MSKNNLTIRLLSLLCASILMLTACTPSTLDNENSSIETSIPITSEVSSTDTTSAEIKAPSVNDGTFDILSLSKKLSVNDKAVSLPCNVSELGGNFKILEKHEKLNVKAMEPTTYVSKLVDNNTYKGEVSEIVAVFVSDVSKTDTDLSKKPITGISICGYNGEPTANSIETLKIDGIGVGSTRDEVLTKFGKPKDPNHPLGIGDKEYAIMRYGDENGYMMYTIDTNTRNKSLGEVVFVSFYLYDKSEKNDPALEGKKFTIYDILNSTKVNGKEVGFPFSFEEIKNAKLTDKFTLEEDNGGKLEYSYYYDLGRIGLEYYPKDDDDYNPYKGLGFFVIGLDKSYESLSEDDEKKYTNSQIAIFRIKKENLAYNPMSVDEIKIGDTREQVVAKMGKQYDLMDAPFDENRLKKNSLYYSDGMVSIYVYVDDNNLVNGITGLINLRRSK